MTATKQNSRSRRWLNFESIDGRALQRAEEFLECWLPDGAKEGREYVALNPLRPDKSWGSFKFNLNSGLWSDFATQDRGKGLISLYAYLKGMSFYEAANYILEILSSGQGRR